MSEMRAGEDAAEEGVDPNGALLACQFAAASASEERVLLCVDDDVNILSSLKRLLRKEDYRLLTANSGEEGLGLLDHDPVQLVMADQRMPGMTGVEFLQKVKELYPATVRVVLSGYADVGLIVDSINRGEIYRFLTKPWNDEELKTSIRQCFGHYEIVRQNRSLMEQIREQNEMLQRMNQNLEEVVEARTQSLRLSQEILEKLPLPVIGISREGMLVLSNEATRDAFPPLRQFAPGAQMEDVFPGPVNDAVALWLGGASPPQLQPFEWHDRTVRMHMVPLREEQSVRGCILILETIKS